MLLLKYTDNGEKLFIGRIKFKPVLETGIYMATILLPKNKYPV